MTFVELQSAVARAIEAERQRDALLRFLGDLCDEHTVCESCGRDCCSECHRWFSSLVTPRHDGGLMNCRDGICEDCADTCRVCTDQIAREKFAEWGQDA